MMAQPEDRDQILRRGDVVPVVIDSLAFGGQGVARLDGLVIFVAGGLPGQCLDVRLIKKKKNFAEAVIERIIGQSPYFQQAVCPHFGACGGCTLQHLVYDQQLRFKHQQVIEALERIGGFTGIEVQPTLPSPDSFYYRNKMEFSFSPSRWLTAAEMTTDCDQSPGLFLGLHVRNFFEKIVDVQACHLLSPLAADLVSTVRAFAQSTGLPAYQTRAHEGFWRFLVIRQSKNLEQLMVNLVTFEHDAVIAEQFRALMLERFPQITSLLYSTTRSRSGVAYGEEEFLLAGRPVIEEKLGDLNFEISSNSFFQTNTRQAERLYAQVARYAGLRPDQTVYDLYCGAGTISLFISRQVRRVIGFESVAAAIADAHKNAAANQVDNCEFVLSDLRNLQRDSEQVLLRYGAPEVLIVDPPRGGMHPQTVQVILKMRPQRIVHVSCNPATLARDLKELCREHYRLEAVQPVDMFPHTYHIEVVAQLTLQTASQSHS
jgi:23S rRNA (uracil1939-C5)-methyltransferase